MGSSDLDDDIDQLALAVEQAIAETKSFLSGLPEFAPRSEKSRKLERATNDDS